MLMFRFKHFILYHHLLASLQHVSFFLFIYLLVYVGLGLLITHNKLPFCLRKRQPNRINVGFSRVLKFNTLNRSPNHEIFSSAKEREDFNDNEPEPFWHSWMYPVKDVVRELWSLVVFLMEQPSQLKYIEWPTFRSTLKTAILTLVLVAALIVVLSTIDSFLIYTLALLLRRPA